MSVTITMCMLVPTLLVVLSVHVIYTGYELDIDESTCVGKSELQYSIES